VTLADVARLPEQRIRLDVKPPSTARLGECVTGSLAICLIVYVTAGGNAGDPYICKVGSKILGVRFGANMISEERKLIMGYGAFVPSGVHGKSTCQWSGSQGTKHPLKLKTFLSSHEQQSGEFPHSC